MRHCHALTSQQVTDNSGAKVVQCINQTGKVWRVGDIITVSVKRAQPRSKVAAGQVRVLGKEREERERETGF